MWTQVYNERGALVSGGWAHLLDVIRKEHTPIIQIEMLEQDLNRRGRFILSTAIQGDDRFSNVVSDGSIDVDYDRGTRRTAELTILNPDSEFTPTTAGFEQDGDWEGLLYLNRVVRIWRGAKAESGAHLYVPVGTFMIDGSEVILEQNMSIVNLTMSDFWKKLSKSYFAYNKKYIKGTYYNAIIKDLLDSAGVPRTGKYAAALDNLSSRAADDKKINQPLKFDRGQSRGDILKDLAKGWNIDMYFDPMGVFRTEDRKSDRDKKTVFWFSKKEIDSNQKNGGLISLTRSFNDDNLYNHVVIVGTGNEKGVKKAVRQVQNENSKFHKIKIGDRVFIKESDKWSTQAEVDKALQRIWAKRIQFSETINAEVICNPALEADDKIRIIERDFVKVDDSYRLRKFNVPLVTSKQTIEATNIIRDEDIW